MPRIPAFLPIMCTAAGAALAASVSLASPVAAQVDPASLVGSRVRLTASRVSFAPLIGRVVSVEGDHIVLERSPTDDHPPEAVRIALASVETVELSAGRRRNAGKGAWMGGVIGFGAGALLGAALGGADDECREGEFIFCDDLSAGEGAGILGPAGAAAGALVGVAIGALTKSERWDEVPPGRWSVSHDAQSGFSLAVRLPL